MASVRESTTELRTLRALSSGSVIAPGDQGYDEARMAWNLAADQRPAAVVLPENERRAFDNLLITAQQDSPSPRWPITTTGCTSAGRRCR